MKETPYFEKVCNYMKNKTEKFEYDESDPNAKYYNMLMNEDILNMYETLDIIEGMKKLKSTEVFEKTIEYLKNKMKTEINTEKIEKIEKLVNEIIPNIKNSNSEEDDEINYIEDKITDYIDDIKRYNRLKDKKKLRINEVISNQLNETREIIKNKLKSLSTIDDIENILNNIEKETDKTKLEKMDNELNEIIESLKDDELLFYERLNGPRLRKLNLHMALINITRLHSGYTRNISLDIIRTAISDIYGYTRSYNNFISTDVKNICSNMYDSMLRENCVLQFNYEDVNNENRNYLIDNLYGEKVDLNKYNVLSYNDVIHRSEGDYESYEYLEPLLVQLNWDCLIGNLTQTITNIKKKKVNPVINYLL
jgi:hypothetical protein